MKVSDYVAGALFEAGVRHVFELSGGMITHLLDSLHRDRRIDIVSVHHEQAAAFAAEGAARVTGIPGVALATSGPGATNLLTGIGSCYFDSTPAVFITGQVNRNEQKGSRAVRQLGFQETDIVSMARPITKNAWQIEEPEQVPEALACAFRVSQSGRPGPVLLDIPMDVQRSQIEPEAWPVFEPELRRGPAVGPLIEALRSARRPLLLVGGGLRASRSVPAFRMCAARLGIPVVHSLMGVDALPFDHPLRVGMIGTYGNRWANLALAESDVLLVLGSRLDVRQTGSRTAEFKGARNIFHVDCDAAEVNNRVEGCIHVDSELPDFFSALAAALEPEQILCTADGWLAEIKALRTRWPDTAESTAGGINPNAFMHELSQVSREACAYVVDVGQHQMWAAQSLELGVGQRFLTSGGMGSMGFALPAALGVLIAKGKPAVVIAGDGGFQCNIQELQTVVRRGLPAKIVVLNNGCHGMVRQFQESYFEKRYQSTMWGYSAPDFAKVAGGYGIPARTVAKPRETAEALRWLWSDPASPALLQVMIDPAANAYPKVAFGQPVDVMEPFGG